MIGITAVLALELALAGPGPAAAAPPAAPPPQAQATPAPAPETRDATAIQALEKMGAYLRTLTTFEVDADASTEQILDDGQMIQLPGTIGLLVQRPNRLRANFYAADKRREFYYDGKTLTIWAPRQGFYSTVEAPPTVEQLVKTMIERRNLVVPLADLFQMGVDPQLTGRITSALFVGTEVVDEQVCNHFAFRQPDVDWQLWIRDGDQPLPCRWVITSINEPGRPSYEVRLDWDLNPAVPAEAFTFVPPEGADRVPIFPDAK